MRHAWLVFFFVMAVGGAVASRAMSEAAESINASGAAELYAKQCASCHGRDGRAKTVKARLKHARNLTDAEWQARVGDERIFNSIMSGKGKMPAFGKKLSEPEIDALVAYVRGLKR